MVKYIVKLELEDAVEADYLKLSAELTRLFFKKEGHVIKNASYLADQITFSRESSTSLQDVSQDVAKAASLTGRKFSFFITKQKANYKY